MKIEDDKYRHKVQLNTILGYCSREKFICRSIVFHLADSESVGAAPSTLNIHCHTRVFLSFPPEKGKVM